MTPRTVCPECRQHHRTRTRDRFFAVALVAWLVLAGCLLVAVFWVES